jgi:hypothetical protein
MGNKTEQKRNFLALNPLSETDYNENAAKEAA